MSYSKKLDQEQQECQHVCDKGLRRTSWLQLIVIPGKLDTFLPSSLTWPVFASLTLCLEHKLLDALKTFHWTFSPEVSCTNTKTFPICWVYYAVASTLRTSRAIRAAAFTRRESGFSADPRVAACPCHSGVVRYARYHRISRSRNGVMMHRAWAVRQSQQCTSCCHHRGPGTGRGGVRGSTARL